MVERRWHLRLVPPAAGLLAAGLVMTSTIGAASGAWEPPPCSLPVGSLPAAVAARGSAGSGQAATWFTLDPVLDAEGTLTGQRLRLGTGAQRERFLELPPESWAAGPTGRVVLVAADDGRRSTIRAVDPLRGCAWALGAEEAAVVRRAVLDPQGEHVYEHRVDRTTRADVGVWRRAVDGSEVERILPPLGGEDDVGLVFATLLAWSAEGDRLAVQSCGAVRCTTRVLDPVSGTMSRPDARDQGELVGLASGRLVHYAPCLGLPCQLVATDVASDSTVVLAEEAGLARLVDDDTGPLVAIEGVDGHLSLVALDGRLARVLDDLSSSDLRLMPGPDRAHAGFDPPPGWIVRSPDGRSPDGAVLTRLADGLTAEIAEVLR